MQDKKSSLLKNIRNFNKKVLSGNQALHKNEVTAKKTKDNVNPIFAVIRHNMEETCLINKRHILKNLKI